MITRKSLDGPTIINIARTVAFKSFKDHLEFDDLVSAGILNILKREHLYKDTYKVSYKNFLYTVARNGMIDHIRRQWKGRKPTIHLDPDILEIVVNHKADSHGDRVVSSTLSQHKYRPDVTVMHNEQKEIVKQIFSIAENILSAPIYEAFVMYYHDEMTLTQISKKTKSKWCTLQARVTHGTEKVREVMQNVDYI